MRAQGYSDVLQLALEALREGAEIEAVLARYPEHAESLRADLMLLEDFSVLAKGVPEPRASARNDAAARLQAELRESGNRHKLLSPAHRRGFGGWRLALAGVAIAVVAGVLLLAGGNGGVEVEAAMLEGVVLEKEGDTLTLQTLDALEQVRVPQETLVSDAVGAGIGLQGIVEGQVVLIDGDRSGGLVTANTVRRLASSIEVWCTDRGDRCRTLAAQLQRAAQQCDRLPAECRLSADRVNELWRRATDIARLEELKQACRSGRPSACSDLLELCRRVGLRCADLAPLLPATPDAGDQPASERPEDCSTASCEAATETATRVPRATVAPMPAQVPAPASPRSSAWPATTATPPSRPEPTPTREPRPTATQAVGDDGSDRQPERNQEEVQQDDVHATPAGSDDERDSETRELSDEAPEQRDGSVDGR